MEYELFLGTNFHFIDCLGIRNCISLEKKSKDFWLDCFYMFFNFFLFSIAISGFYDLMQLGFDSMGLSLRSLVIIDLTSLPQMFQLLIFFFVLDFVQWTIHILLHKIPAFWKFHQIHDSVKE